MGWTDLGFFYLFFFFFLLFTVIIIFIPIIFIIMIIIIIIIVIVSEALFYLCRGTNNITLLGCDRISGHVPRLFISFFSFFVDSYFAGARKTQEDTL